MKIRVLVPLLLIAATACSPSTPAPTAAASTSPTPTSTAAPPDEVALAQSTDDALRIVDGYFAAYDAGDIVAMVDAMTTDVRIAEDTLDQWRNLHEWKAAEGTEILSRDCAATEDGEPGRVVVLCRYQQHQYLAQVVDAPTVPYTSTYVITADGIAEITERFGSPDFTVVDEPFNAWMSAHHPGDAEAAECCGASSVEQSRANGRLRAAYADRWAAWLADHPTCDWSDTTCQADPSTAEDDPQDQADQTTGPDPLDAPAP